MSSIPSASAAIVFIACHGGPAEHFAVFQERMAQNVQILALRGPAEDAFNRRNVAVHYRFSLENQDRRGLAQEIAKSCAAARTVITDVGHDFDLVLHEELDKLNVNHWVYYDNPESLVRGGYSRIAAEVMQQAQGILFANALLADRPIYRDMGEEVVFRGQQRIGIGYYPLAKAEQLKSERMGTEKKLRLIQELGLSPEQKICIYFGGNNDEYFNNAFPLFLDLLGQSQDQLKDLSFVIHQHPGAKKDNKDGRLLEEWQKKHAGITVILSSLKNSDEAQVIADIALYHQTSMGPQFALIGIPTMQVGDEPFPDLLVANGIAPSVTTAERFKQELLELASGTNEAASSELILNALGYHADWENRLRIALLP